MASNSLPEGTSATGAAHPAIAVLIPCYNEEATIASVVGDFRKALPDAAIYVYENNCTDRTAAKATAAGAIVRTEKLQGKGNVVRRMFADIDADIYILVDGDDTYDAASAPALVGHLIDAGLDMVNARRVTTEAEAYRTGHRFGNWLLTELAARFFRKHIDDMLSGYRVFSRRFVKSFPARSPGFEIETELTIHALELRMPIDELDTPYKSRPPESPSKLSTYRDGYRILVMIFDLLKSERPLLFFSIIGFALMAISIGTAVPQVILPWIETGVVIRYPTALLVTALMILSVLSFGIGLILDTVTRGRQEAKRLSYLSIPPVHTRFQTKRA